MKYFQVWPDMNVIGRWILGDVRHLNNWDLIKPPNWLMEPGHFQLDVTQQGHEMDYSFAGYACVTVVSDAFRTALAGLPEVDEPYRSVVMESVSINGQEVGGSYFLLIVETRLDCIDELRSDFTRFEIEDAVRPDLAGEYSAFTKLVIDADRVAGHHIFRLEGFAGALVVSEEVKSRLDAAGVVGIEYDLVSGN